MLGGVLLLVAQIVLLRWRERRESSTVLDIAERSSLSVEKSCVRGMADEVEVAVFVANAFDDGRASPIRRYVEALLGGTTLSVLATVIGSNTLLMIAIAWSLAEA